MDLASLYRVIKLFSEKFFFENDFDDLVPVIIISCLKSCVIDAGCVCDACLYNNRVLLVLITHLLDTPVKYTSPLLHYSGFALQRNEEYVVRSEKADASIFSDKHRKRCFAVWIGRAHTSSSNNT